MSDLRLRLKTATQPLHDRVEAAHVMSRLMRDDLTREQYGTTLARMHALYVPLEADLERLAGLPAYLPDLSRRMKVRSLGEDLADLGVAPHPPIATVPIADVPSALGTLYVLEGSTMGGRLIAKALRTRDFVKASNLRFFEHYGAEAGAMWQSFVRALERVPTADHAATEAAAIRTFEYFAEL